MNISQITPLHLLRPGRTISLKNFKSHKNCMAGMKK
jgi:hypothetical protein